MAKYGLGSGVLGTGMDWQFLIEPAVELAHFGAAPQGGLALWHSGCAA